jgi:hypothetical protein
MAVLSRGFCAPSSTLATTLVLGTRVEIYVVLSQTQPAVIFKYEEAKTRICKKKFHE